MSSDDQDYSSDGGDHNRAPVSASRSSHNAGGADRSHRPLRAHSSSTAPYFLPAPHSKLPNRYPPSYRMKPEQGIPGIPGNPVPGDGGPYPKFPEFPLQPVPMPAHSSREGSGSDEEGYSDDERHRRGPDDQHLPIASGSGGGAYGSAAPPAFPPTREDYDQLAYQENFEGEELQDANGMATLPPKPIKRGSGPTKLCVCQWPGCGMVFKKMGHLNQVNIFTFRDRCACTDVFFLFIAHVYSHWRKTYTEPFSS